MKKLLLRILASEPIEILAVAFIILFLGGLLVMLSGCGLVESLTGTAKVASDTVESIDKDGSGVISMQEIIQYCFAGWVAGRATETAGRFGVKRLRNGRKQNGGRADEQSSCP